MSLQNVFGDLALDASVQEVVTTLQDGTTVVSPTNVQTEFRESFETYNTTTVWSQSVASGDIVQLDGNAASCSYLVISKDALTAGGETIVETRASFTGPFETAVGLHMSQRVLGQECSMEFVSTDTPLPPVADIAISSIVQSTTTLTVTTATPHGFTAGQRIGIYGVVDSRLNYPSLVVLAVASTTVFTAQGGPGGTIPSGTLGPFSNQGYVYYRPALGYAQEGVSEIFENTSATNASVYVRSDSGDALPSGAANANQSLSVGSTASAQLILAANTYAFNPGIEYRFQMQADRVQFLDAPMDNTGVITTRLNRTSVVPNVTKTYKLRFRVTNDKGLTVPTAKIVSAVKSASTTATITTATAHGLTTNDYIIIVGIRDQTNFANQTTQVVVASVINSTQFTVVFGASATATSYGGMVAKVQGANVPTSLVAPAIQTVASIATSFGNQLNIFSATNWGWTVGDYVNVYGVRDNATGADLGVDGSYKVSDVSATNIVLLPIGSTTLPTTFGTTNCGGTAVKRTDVRISYARIFQYLRERVEIPSRSDSQSSVPVYLNSGVSLNAGANLIGYTAPNNYSLQSSTNLASGATFTGTTQNAASSTTSTISYNAQLVIGVSHTAGLTPGQLYLDLGTENSSTTPTVWYQSLAVPIPSNANWQQFSVPLSTRYYRLRFVNGATAQTNFRLTSYITSNGGGLSGQMAFPMNLQYPLSITALAANAVFTGATMDFGDTMNVYQTLTAVAYSDQASASNGMQIQISRDGTNWRVAQQTSLVANTLTSITAHLSYRYARVVYTNGATLQGSFNLDAHVDAN